MSKNLWQTKNGNVTHACTVPAGTKSGDVQLLGDYLCAWALTDRATATTIANGTAAHNLADGEATCELAGVSTVVLLPMTGAMTQYAVVARGSGGTYGAAAGRGIGIALSAGADGETIPVALLSSLPDLT